MGSAPRPPTSITSPRANRCMTWVSICFRKSVRTSSGSPRCVREPPNARPRQRRQTAGLPARPDPRRGRRVSCLTVSSIARIAPTYRAPSAHAGRVLLCLWLGGAVGPEPLRPQAAALLHDRRRRADARPPVAVPDAPQHLLPRHGAAGPGAPLPVRLPDRRRPDAAPLASSSARC